MNSDWKISNTNIMKMILNLQLRDHRGEFITDYEYEKMFSILYSLQENNSLWCRYS